MPSQHNSSSLTIANWNLEWATTRQARYPRIHNHLDTDIDVACFTEVNLGSIPHSAEHFIAADADTLAMPNGRRVGQSGHFITRMRQLLILIPLGILETT